MGMMVSTNPRRRIARIVDFMQGRQMDNGKRYPDKCRVKYIENGTGEIKFSGFMGVDEAKALVGRIRKNFKF